ncbi:hypothetical protein [Acidovorax sp. LjRoot117]|uniref:hypothetical protein n=1 Tax=Acidovorax sp. LjRoot117 TaxID=3342255 RepID=UPI003ECEA8A0
MNFLSSFARRSLLKGVAAAVSALALASPLHAQIIPKKIAVYTDSIGDGGNVGRKSTTAGGNSRGPVSQYVSYPGYSNSPSDYNFALRIHQGAGSSDYDAQQFGASTLWGMMNGMRPDLSTDPADTLYPFGGLTLVQHAAAIQADTVIIHLGGNDGVNEGIPQGSAFDAEDKTGQRIAALGIALAAEGRRLIVIEAPYVVPEDTAAAFLGTETNPDLPDHTPASVLEAYHAYTNHFTAVSKGITNGVNAVNAVYPGYAARVNYWSNGAVPMSPGATHEGLHPTLGTHNAIANAVAIQVKAWRGW